MKILTHISTLLFAVLILAGCSKGPSDSLVEDALVSKSDDFVTVSNVQRVNGYEDGNKYVVDVNYIMTFKVSFEELYEQSSKFDRMALDMLTMMTGKWEKGDFTEHEESLTFVDSEYGWKLL